MIFDGTEKELVQVMKQIKKSKKSAIVIILSMVLTLSACTNPINVSGGTGDKDGDANAHANIVSTTSATQAIDDSWKGIYANFLENEMTDILGDYVSEEYDTWTFGFIFVNDDNIPELVISSGYEAGGNIILTIANGEVDFFYTRRLGFYYDERGNVLINADGHMGVYFDYVYTITDDGFELIKSGEYYDIYDDEDGYSGEREYYLDEVKVSEEEYYEQIDSYIPASERVRWTLGSTSQSILDYLKGNNYTSAKEAYRAVVEDALGTQGVYFALLETDYNTYLLLDNNNWVYIYYYQDGVPFRGADFYLSTSSSNQVFFYPETGVACSYFPSYNIGSTYYIFTSNMGSTYHAYAHFHEVTDENGEVLKDEEGMYIFEYTVNGETVSEMDYAEFLKQYDSEKIIVLNSASTNDNSDYEYHTPEEMLDLLSE